MTLKEALRVINRKEPVDIEFVTLDERRKKGGQHRSLIGAVCCGSSHDSSVHDTVTMQPREVSANPVSIHVKLIMKLNKEWVL